MIVYSIAPFFCFHDKGKLLSPSPFLPDHLTDANIVKYAPILKQEGALELLKAWETKNRSNRHIDDKLRYCNTAFVRAGKQALEDAKQTKIDAKNEAAEAKLIVQQALNLK